MIFGGSHPAIAFLLLLAIADDAIGLLILAVFYPSKPLEPGWFLLTLIAMLICYLLRKNKVHTFWAYLLIPGVLSWLSFDLAGIHPALGLVPIIPCLPHAHTDLGIFAREELNRKDTLNEMMRWWKNPVELVLGLFGLVNAGVLFDKIGQGTYLVLLGLIVGKPLGICLFTWIAKALFRLEMPAGMTARHVLLVGVISSIGFTVALFVSTAAFKDPDSGILAEVKMGALFSFFGAVVAFMVARILRIRPLIEGGLPETNSETTT
jgi:NhaA family Na+:H+ antiporter